MLEEIERVRPSGAMSDEDFAALQTYLRQFVPEDLQARMDAVLGSMTGQTLVETADD